jgi:putative lipase involved disintegration of autophagic bodies
MIYTDVRRDFQVNVQKKSHKNFWGEKWSPTKLLQNDLVLSPHLRDSEKGHSYLVAFGYNSFEIVSGDLAGLHKYIIRHWNVLVCFDWH